MAKHQKRKQPLRIETSWTHLKQISSLQLAPTYSGVCTHELWPRVDARMSGTTRRTRSRMPLHLGLCVCLSLRLSSSCNRETSFRSSSPVPRPSTGSSFVCTANIDLYWIPALFGLSRCNITLFFFLLLNNFENNSNSPSSRKVPGCFHPATIYQYPRVSYFHGSIVS